MHSLATGQYQLRAWFLFLIQQTTFYLNAIFKPLWCSVITLNLNATLRIMFSHLTLFLLIKHRKTFRWAFLTTMVTRKRNNLIKMLTFLFQIHLAQSPLQHDILKIVISYIANSLFSLYIFLFLYFVSVHSLWILFLFFSLFFSISHLMR